MREYEWFFYIAPLVLICTAWLLYNFLNLYKLNKHAVILALGLNLLVALFICGLTII